MTHHKENNSVTELLIEQKPFDGIELIVKKQSKHRLFIKLFKCFDIYHDSTDSFKSKCFAHIASYFLLLFWIYSVISVVPIIGFNQFHFAVTSIYLISFVLIRLATLCHVHYNYDNICNTITTAANDDDKFNNASLQRYDVPGKFCI